MKTTILTLALGASVLAFAATPATSVSAQDVQRVSAVVQASDLSIRESAKAKYRRIENKPARCEAMSATWMIQPACAPGAPASATPRTKPSSV